MGKVFKKITKPIQKLIPKEIKPILPYAALFIPGLQGAAGAFAKMGITNALAQKAIIAAATKGLSDDKAKFGDIARTAALAVAPDVIQQGLGSLGNAINPLISIIFLLFYYANLRVTKG